MENQISNIFDPLKNPAELLKKYWGFDNFKFPQEEIINELLNNKDVLALMPTGGGKSICFQVPALLKKGICVVISPLIALINDQIERLKKQGIKAVAINSTLSNREIDIVLDNCIYGDIKLLYIAPERISSDIFLERFKKMDVNLLAIDEAHCISQWGYTFRPSYLNIIKLRELKPKVNIIALTATATNLVRQDIIKNLELKDVKIIKKSFKRDNIAYSVKQSENKNFYLKALLKNTNEPAIIYTGTRRETKEISNYLNHFGIPSDYYHAGLNSIERENKQKEWMNETKKVIVSTNAFGMGIDKPNVRYVIHMCFPLTLEEYYQESGRAGRDQKSSEAILLYNKGDIEKAHQKLKEKFPSLEYTKILYNKLCNYYAIASGSGMSTYEFDIEDFSRTFNFDINECYYGLKVLEKLEILQLNMNSKCSEDKVMFKINPQQIYYYRVKNEYFSDLIDTILRIYGGEVFSQYCKISIKNLSKALNMSLDLIEKGLKQLHKREIIDYQPRTSSESFTFLVPRMHPNNLNFNYKDIIARKKIEFYKAQKVIEYILEEKKCRSKLLLQYFDEYDSQNCNNCDNCLKTMILEENNYKKMILNKINEGYNTLDQLIEKINPKEKEMILNIIRAMLNDKSLFLNNNALFIYNQNSSSQK